MNADCDGDCSDALDNLERFLDGELEEGNLREVSAHLARCYPCAERKEFEEQLRAFVRHRCSEQAPPSLITRIQSYLDQAPAPG